MKLYITGISSYRSDENDIDIKNELKKKYKLDTRRQNDFIHLGIFGAKKLQDEVNINVNDELYITSGVGNIDVVQEATESIHKNEFMKIFDFINMLGNTTSYYISKSLNIKGKSLFQISDNFTFINSLISIYASLYSSKKNAILGSIDLVSEPDEIIKRILGVSEDCNLVSSVNYQKLSLSKEKAIAEIEFDTKIYSQDEIKTFLDENKTKVIFSSRCKEFYKDNEIAFCETIASSIINKHINNRVNLVYIDFYDKKYKVLKLNLLTKII
ncbi:hypothetical protein SMGD1_1379 [Sulfurimonas gotlandica GD1]|uniref:Beta-ketoacyl synthase N-terminal domain-containing protein n=1 Tax=Sulfurimonas gotlandica (strain DSM 19862 / JCM 16533 / GD1) TaxID=929558 RepID=B6BHB1_SULGG|nr:hypothetical protein [Sulfurimonas gotlandica]EDZ63072.1 hypothetical protein CBGD1_691 [Sulfurimonas gotlandica GD1]EHP29903.1 hypothetical protein SMGD1_1379 [Sulfurimonas gotlandica GD1]